MIVVETTPAKPLAILAAEASASSMSSPSAGLIWIVASREICVCHVVAVSRTSVTAPSVRQERNVMIAITSTMARDATLSAGTMGAWFRARLLEAFCAIAEVTLCTWASAPARWRGLVIAIQPAAGTHHAPRVHLIHQPQVVRCDHNRDAHAVEFDE